MAKTGGMLLQTPRTLAKKKTVPAKNQMTRTAKCQALRRGRRREHLVLALCKIAPRAL